MLFTDGEANEGIKDTVGIMNAIDHINFSSDNDDTTNVIFNTKQEQSQCRNDDRKFQHVPKFGVSFRLNQDREISRKIRRDRYFKETQTKCSNYNAVNSQTIECGKELRKTDNKNNDIKHDDENGSKMLLSYTINTFGFGTNHNAGLLQAIAEKGKLFIIIY